MEQLVIYSQELVQLSFYREILINQQNADVTVKILIGDSPAMDLTGSRHLIISDLFTIIGKREEVIKDEMNKIMFPKKERLGYN